MKLRASSYVLIGIMVIGLFFGSIALTYPSIRTFLFPAAIGFLVFVLAGIELIKDLRKAAIIDQSKGQEVGSSLGGENVKPIKYFAQFGWMLGLLLGIYLVGFLISVPLFILTYLKVNKRGWLASIVGAAITTLIIYLVFVVVLQVILFPGVLFGGLM